MEVEVERQSNDGYLFGLNGYLLTYTQKNITDSKPSNDINTYAKNLVTSDQVHEQGEYSVS